MHVATLLWELNRLSFLQIFSRYGRKSKQILIFSVFKIASLSPYILQIKFLMSLFFYLFTFAINLWLQRFVTANVTAVFVNTQPDIQQWGQHFNKKLVFQKVQSKEVGRQISRENINMTFKSKNRHRSSNNQPFSPLYRRQNHTVITIIVTKNLSANFFSFSL